MPLYTPDPTYAAIQALPGRRRNRQWMPPGTSGPPVPTPFWVDNFTGTDGANLTAHTSDSGATYAKEAGMTGDAFITANRASFSTSAESRYLASATPPTANYEVAASVRIISSTHTAYSQLIGRADPSANTAFTAIFYNSAGVWYMFLRRFLTGSFAELGGGPVPLPVQPTVGNDYPHTLRMVDDHISVFWNNNPTPVMTATDGNLMTAGLAGFGGFGNSTVGHHIDSISAIQV